jgi:carbonic anhydrase
MISNKRWLAGLALAIALVAGGFVVWPGAQFTVGGAMVNVGFRLQDHLQDYDLVDSTGHDAAPDTILERLLAQNHKAAAVRSWFPRTARHPIVAAVVCMDGRLDTAELMGDTRKYYYVVRTAGSVLEAKEQDMLQLAVEQGVSLILLTTHTDCAAEKLAADPARAAHLPSLSQAVGNRSVRIDEFLHRPAIAERLADGRLEVVEAEIDTQTAELLVTGKHGHGTTATVAPM